MRKLSISLISAVGLSLTAAAASTPALAQISVDLNLGRPTYYQPNYGTRYDYHGRPYYYAPRYAPYRYRSYNNSYRYYQPNYDSYNYPGYYGR